MVKRLRHRPFTAVSGVRVPLGVTITALKYDAGLFLQSLKTVNYAKIMVTLKYFKDRKMSKNQADI